MKRPSLPNSLQWPRGERLLTSSVFRFLLLDDRQAQSGTSMAIPIVLVEKLVEDRLARRRFAPISLRDDDKWSIGS